MSYRPIKWTAPLAALLLAASFATAADKPPVSFHKDVMPIFKKSCTGCHRPDKMKGKLDMSNFAALMRGGKNGHAVKPGDVKSLLLEQISGPEPEMPEEADPLSPAEVDIIRRWIEQGAKDDTPTRKLMPDRYPVYSNPPVVSAMRFTPDGQGIAVSGFHEVIIHAADGSRTIARLLGESPRIESIQFSHSGTLIAVAGGAPGEFGQVQIWDAATHKRVKSHMESTDSLYGVSFSPDDTRVAVGSADKRTRVLEVETGNRLLLFENHADWVLATTFSTDGKQLISASRDRAMKLVDLANGRFIDDVNKLLEPVLCIDRHPTENIVAYGGELGTTRIYKMKENLQRTAANNDTNLVKMFDRLKGAVYAVRYAPDGKLLAIGGHDPEVRLHTMDGKVHARLTGHSGPIFAIAFDPKGERVATGGYDGVIRVYEVASGKLLHSFSAAPKQEKVHAPVETAPVAAKR